MLKRRHVFAENLEEDYMFLKEDQHVGKCVPFADYSC
jgi:hypothetical protein